MSHGCTQALMCKSTYTRHTNGHTGSSHKGGKIVIAIAMVIEGIHHYHRTHESEVCNVHSMAVSIQIYIYTYMYLDHSLSLVPP